MLQLKALSGPETLSFSPGIASCPEGFDGQQNCGGLSYSLSHHDRKCELQGHLVGTRIAGFWLDKNHTVDAELRRIESGACRSLWLLRARYPQQKEFSMLPSTPAQVKPAPSLFLLCLHLILPAAKTQWISPRSSSAILRAHAGLPRAESPVLAPPPCCEQPSATASSSPAIGVKWAQHCYPNTLLDLKAAHPKFYQRNLSRATPV